MMSTAVAMAKRPKFQSKFIKKYNEQLQVKNPIKTRIITAFVLSAVGDVICQSLIERPALQRKQKLGQLKEK